MALFRCYSSLLFSAAPPDERGINLAILQQRSEFEQAALRLQGRVRQGRGLALLLSLLAMGA